jgi:protein-S-isoprenylcysteine O-methyltransferase Ste14
MNDDARRPRTLILPPAPYAVALALGWWLDRHVAPLPLDASAATHPLGMLLVAAGLALMAATMLTFLRHRTTVNPFGGASALCTGGVFRLSRNPIYLGDWLVFIGLALMWHTAWPLLFSPLIWALLRYGVIRHEEAHLAAKFGDDYRQYCARVRRWI